MTFSQFALYFNTVDCIYLLQLVRAVFVVPVTDTPDTDEVKLPESTAAEEWNITSPPLEQRPADASATPTPPEKKKKPRNRGMGKLTVVILRNTCLYTFADKLDFTCSLCVCLM